MMTHNNQILSFKTLCCINECLLLFLLKMELEPCNLFSALYVLQICHVMIFSSKCEMKLVAYHNIVMLKICK